MRLLVPLLFSAGAMAQVSISMQPADQAMVPWSVRSVYADVEGTADTNIRWTVTGGCTLAHPETNAAPQLVIAPAQGGRCTLSKQDWAKTVDSAHPSFTSPVMCKVTATSAADPSKSAVIQLPVCAPHVMLSTFPESTVLYKSQYAVIQSDVRGSLTTDVTWSITANPGNAGTLTGGSNNRHAVFSASAAGTYVLTATSLADAQKKASTTIYVTANPMPAPNANHTEPVDCTPVGKGKVYDVGPLHAYKDLNAVPWNQLRGGGTVRIFNDDTTGAAPTTYHQHVSIAAGGTPTQPLRVCGVPDAHGIKPIIDGDNASTGKDQDWVHTSLEDLGIIMLYDGAHKWDTTKAGNENVLIEGLHIRNAQPTYQFIAQADGVPKKYNPSVACIHVHTGHAVLIRGNELDNCAQAVFSNSQVPEGGIITDLTVEGNAMQRWGSPRFDRVHGMYLQAIGLTVQFNYFGAVDPAVNGNAIKSRSVLNFLRWNYISQTQASVARSFDMVEPQNYFCYVIPHGFAQYHSPKNSDCYPPHEGVDSDPMNPDTVAANFEALHSDYIYGNIMEDQGSQSSFVHYGYDQQTDYGPYFGRRGGTLYYWNNTHLEHKAHEYKMVFDSMYPDSGHSYEFPSIESINNVFAADNSVVYLWTLPLWQRVVVNSNWMKPGALLPNRNSEDNFQGGVPPESRAGCGMYGRCQSGNGHMEWLRNGKPGTQAATLYTGPTPFDSNTFLPGDKLRGLGATLPQAIHNQPSNMEYLPATNVIQPRKDAAVLGALE